MSEKEMVSCRITVKNLLDGFKYVQYNTYGVKLDNRTIRTAEGYTFHAGRKTGFGKTCKEVARINDNPCHIIIDRIETYMA